MFKFASCDVDDQRMSEELSTLRL